MSHPYHTRSRGKHTLPGSARPPVAGAKLSAIPPPADDLVTVSVIMRGKNPDRLRSRLQSIHAGESLPHLSAAQYAEQFGAAEADLAAVRAFAHTHQLTVAAEHSGRRTVRLRGTVAAMQAALGVELVHYEHGGITHRGYTGEVQLPTSLAGVVESVLGLDTRPVARPAIHRRDAASAAASRSFSPLQVAQLYQFPAGSGSSSYNIALIELGGGYKATQLSAYFTQLGVSPAPKLVAVSVDGATNSPGGDADAEVQLDIEVAGAIASKASLIVYFAPNTDAGFLDAVTTAAHDAAHRIACISISWGGPESSWTAATMQAFDSAFAAAAVMGISTFVASGDSGSSDGESGKHVDFPASSPHCTGCGGTTLTASRSSISSETVWSGSGGGVSGVFALPVWQQGVKETPSSSRSAAAAITKRGVPDVCGNGDPNSGYAISVDGSAEVVGGTSAVAPLWAALTALTCARQGRKQGLLNPALYANTAQLRDITAGSNGGYRASVGWDACSGLGSITASTLQSSASA